MPAKQAQSLDIFQFKITLHGSRPPIWRRVHVKCNTSLDKLHEIIQVVMGWENYHLYKFTIRGIDYSIPDFELEMENAKRTKLDDVISSERERLVYEYDFGDGWEHDILVEKILPAEKGKRYPICITGKRACPPEDCGGIWGYAELLEIIQDPDHEEYEEKMEWLGEEFDPEEFDLNRVNRMLRR